MSASTSSDYEAIRNTLALYCIALDAKDFALFDRIFTPDVETIYPFGGKRQGVEDIKTAIQKRLAPVTTQHALTTQRIVLADEGQTAEVITYFTGIHFGRGRWEGNEVTAWGKYADSLQRVGSGEWRIARREVEDPSSRSRFFVYAQAIRRTGVQILLAPQKLTAHVYVNIASGKRARTSRTMT